MDPTGNSNNQPAATAPASPVVDVPPVATGVAEAVPPVVEEKKTEFVEQFGAGLAPEPNQQVIDEAAAKIVPEPEDPQAVFIQDIKNAVAKLEMATKEKSAV